MKKWFRYICTILFLLSKANADGSNWNAEINGYGYELGAYQRLSDAAGFLGDSVSRNLFLDLTRLRIRPTLNLWDNARIDLQYEADLFISKYQNPLFGTFGKTNRQAIDLSWQPVSESNYYIRHYIDRLSFKQIFDFAEFVIGRQRVDWGVGRVWQPTDLFNPLNPANFSKIEKDGADAASAKFFLGNFTDLELVWNFMDKLENDNYGFRFRTNYNPFDISLIAGYFDHRAVVGADFAGNLFDAGIRGEGIISMNKDNLSSNYVRFILGADYQLTSLLYIMLEYQMNGEGITDKMHYDLVGLANGTILNLNRNYLTCQLRYALNPLMNLTGGIMTNLNDGSGYFMAGLDFAALSNLTLSLAGMVTAGSNFSEYWYYPTSLYLTAQYFF